MLVERLARPPDERRARGPVELRSDGNLLRLLLGRVRVAARAVQELDRAGDDLHPAALCAVCRLP